MSSELQPSWWKRSWTKLEDKPHRWPWKWFNGLFIWKMISSWKIVCFIVSLLNYDNQNTIRQRVFKNVNTRDRLAVFVDECYVGFPSYVWKLTKQKICKLADVLKHFSGDGGWRGTNAKRDRKQTKAVNRINKWQLLNELESASGTETEREDYSCCIMWAVVLRLQDVTSQSFPESLTCLEKIYLPLPDEDFAQDAVLHFIRCTKNGWNITKAK